MTIIGINYDITECGTIKYNFIYIPTKNDTVNKFISKSFVKDWYNAMKYLVTEVLDDNPGLAYSSSVNDFIMDGADYDSAYLVVKDNDDFELSYDREMSLAHIEFFVEKGTTPTWEELKKLVE